MDNLIKTQFELIKLQAKHIDTLTAQMLRGGIYKITDKDGNDLSLERAAILEQRAVDA